MNFTFIGDSLVAGSGFSDRINDPAIYPNIVSSHYGASAKNLAVGGQSNYEIFMLAIQEILYSCPDKLFIHWSGLRRVWFYPGPNEKVFFTCTDTELEYYRRAVKSRERRGDYEYMNTHISQEDMKTFVEVYNQLTSDYNLIFRLVDYSNILSTLAKGKTEIIFINGLLNWTDEIADKEIATNFKNRLSDYTKRVIEFDHRTDDEISELLRKLSEKINTLDFSKWVSMFTMFGVLPVDKANDNAHPGPESHKIYSNLIIAQLEKNKNEQRL